MKFWIARDRDGKLYLYRDKPERIGDSFFSMDPLNYMTKSLFPEVTFENSPQQVEIKLIK